MPWMISFQPSCLWSPRHIWHSIMGRLIPRPCTPPASAPFEGSICGVVFGIIAELILTAARVVPSSLGNTFLFGLKDALAKIKRENASPGRRRVLRVFSSMTDFETNVCRRLKESTILGYPYMVTVFLLILEFDLDIRCPARYFLLIKQALARFFYLLS
jgi:hypothetical protein